jgi:GDP-4-dehydro-6-deoxy-D-mannose reductase
MRVGNLHPKRDFSDVRDVTAAYVSVLREGRAGEIYNVCSGVLRPVQEILDVLIDISKCKIEVKVDSTLTRKIEVLELGGDPQKLLAVTSWKPRISLRTTLEDLLSYWKKRLADERNSAGT